MTTEATTNTFSSADRHVVESLIMHLTGIFPDTQIKIDSCLLNIRRRMIATGSRTLEQYLRNLEKKSSELGYFISSVTIHTTSWFREMPHYDRLRHIATPIAEALHSGRRIEPFRALSAGCSTGEEVYSLGLVLEDLRSKFSNFEYLIEGWDVDPICVGIARQGIYKAENLSKIPDDLRRFLMIGTEKTQGLFTTEKAIRTRCNFVRRSVLVATQAPVFGFDLAFCRNVLIYFAPKAVRDIVYNLLAQLRPGGHLCLGHSESIDAGAYNLDALGNTTYRKPNVDAMPSEADTKKETLVRPDLIVIGASTGGTETLVKLLQRMPKPCPPIVVVQHIAPTFYKPFAERLAANADLHLGVPKTGVTLQFNHIYLAWGEYHLGLRRRGDAYILEISNDPPLHGVRPSVDFLFQSIARLGKATNVIGILLTGMGKDGARGLKELSLLDAMTFAQNEATSAVFGMPREAILLGAAGFVGSPAEIRTQLNHALDLPRTKDRASA